MTVPGSDYGKRMLSPRPGLNQIEAAVERLKEDPSTRRAAIAIYAPEDAVRESRDIPCAFGLMFHIRGGMLSSAVFMRSNNAMTLMPYNLFEFSLLAEVVAASLCLPLGPMFYFAGSMHMFADALERAQGIVDAEFRLVQTCPVPAIPTDPPPSEQISALIKIEADARHAASGLSEKTFASWVDRAQNELNAYWRQYAFLLLLEMARKRQLQPALDSLRELIASPWKDFIPDVNFTSEIAAAAPVHGLFEVAVPAAVRADAVESVTVARMASLERLCAAKSSELRAANGIVISFGEYRELRDRFVGDIDAPASIAARELPREIQVDAFEQALKDIRAADGDESYDRGEN
jgi:hypothetical protein